MAIDKDLLLAELLECGTSDLFIVTDTDYGISDMIDHIKDNFGQGQVNLGTMFLAIVELGMNDLMGAIESKKEEFQDFLDTIENFDEDEVDEDGVSNKEKIEAVKEELEILNELEPYEDFTTFFNYIDTHVNYKDEETQEKYEKVIPLEVEEIEGRMGFSFTI